MGNEQSSNSNKNKNTTRKEDGEIKSGVKDRSVPPSPDLKVSGATMSTVSSEALSNKEIREKKEEDVSSPSSPTKTRPKLSDGYVYHSSVAGEISLGANWKRRRQALSMYSCSLYFMMPAMMFCHLFVIYCIIRPHTSIFGILPPIYSRTILAMYLGYILLWDRSPTDGSRNPWMRSFKVWWGHACDYLPMLLVKTAHLPSDEKYVLGYHPHGIISVGAFTAFATDSAQTLDLTSTGESFNEDDEILVHDIFEDEPSTSEAAKSNKKPKRPRGFSSLFPGIDRRVLTLKQNFLTPLMREYMLWMGACDASRESFRNILAKPGGSAVIVVVGGAAESLLVQPGCMDIILEHRRGFVREAIMANANLVPVLGFGESDLYHVFDVDSKSKMAKVQKFVKKYMGIGMPIFQGRSMFMRNYGFMAKRTPVCVVVGAPIPPPDLKGKNKNFFPLIDRKTDEPLNEDGIILKRHHSKYMEELQKLERTHKNAYWNIPGRKRTRSLRIIK